MTNQNFPLVSFLIPTYNEEKCIGKCLESILDQDYPLEKLEVIVIDGLSSDKTVEITRNYPVKVVVNKKRIIPEACTLGIQIAQGDIVAFMGADSELPQRNWIKLMIAPLLLDEQVAGSIPILKPNKNYPAISRFFSLMQADPFIVFAYGSGLEVKNGYVTEENYFPMGISVIRKQLLAGPQSFKSSLQRSEDVDITFRLVKQGYKFAVVQDAGLYHLFIDNYSNYLRKTYGRVKNFVKSSSNIEFSYVPKKRTKNQFLKNLLFDMMGIGSLVRIIKGIKQDRDLAWLCYPFVLLTTLTFYTIAFTSSKEGRRLFREFTGMVQNKT